MAKASGMLRRWELKRRGTVKVLWIILIRDPSEGGSKPLWVSDRRELFYRNGNKMMEVEISTQPEFRAAKPEVLFEGACKKDPTGPQYDITPEGRRFVMMRENEQVAAATRLNVVLNWLEELKQKGPVCKQQPNGRKWLGGRDSNPDRRIQSPQSYR